MSEQVLNGIKPKKDKKSIGAFPRLSLTKSLELLNVIYDLGEGEQVRRRTIFDRLGKSPDSGSSRQLVITSNSGYGLITGGYQAEYLGLTELGKIIATAQNAFDKFEAIYNSLYNNEIFSSFMNRFNDKSIPIDEVAIEFFKNSHKLSISDANLCWSVFKENILDQNLSQELSGKRVIISKEEALKTIVVPMEDVTDGTTEKDAVIPPLNLNSKDTKPPSNTYRKNEEYITPQIHFNIQVIIPENASADTYDAIFRSIASHLLNRNEGK